MGYNNTTSAVGIMREIAELNIQKMFCNYVTFNVAT